MLFQCYWFSLEEDHKMVLAMKEDGWPLLSVTKTDHGYGISYPSATTYIAESSNLNLIMDAVKQIVKNRFPYCWKDF